MSFKPYTEKIKKKKNWNLFDRSDPDPEPDPDPDPSSRKRIRIKMIRIRNTGFFFLKWFSGINPPLILLNGSTI